MAVRPCSFCGYPFDVDLLGRFGCPNCLGEGLDSDDAGRINILSLCTGGGGLDLGVELAVPAARSVCYVEGEAFAVAHLVEAMRAGYMAEAPVWSDVRTFDGRPWRGLVDGLIGGIPCQPHSIAGSGDGFDDPRELWEPTARIVAEAEPGFVFIENVAGFLSSGVERVTDDLRAMGYRATAGLFSAREIGMPQVSNTHAFVLAALASPERSRLEGHVGRELEKPHRRQRPDAHARGRGWWGSEPGVGRVAGRDALTVDRVRMLGNCVPPLVAAYAFVTLWACLEDRKG